MSDDYLVACAREDGLLNVHSEEATCEVCEPPITPEDLGTATNDYDVVMPGDMLIGVDPGDEDDIAD